MKRLKTLIIFISTILIASSCANLNAVVTQEEIVGEYLFEMDVNIFRRLILKPDNSFEYTDHGDKFGNYHHKGLWKIQKSIIVLYKCDNNIGRPMPLKWEIKSDTLIGETVTWGAKTKIKSVLVKNPKE